MANIFEQIKRNRRNTWVVMTVFVLFFLFLGAGFDYFYNEYYMPYFTILALIIAIISGYAGYNYGDRLILSSTHAQEVDPTDLPQKQWYNAVEEMSISAGIPMPRVYVIDDPDPNAFATGKDPEHSSIAATKGLLETLNRDELQAVAAHEMSHIKNYDIRLMLIITVLIGSVSLMSEWSARGRWRGRRGSGGGRSDGADAIFFAIWLAAAILTPILSQLVAMSVSRNREYLADASGAELTRNPIALVSAREKIDSKRGPTRSMQEGTAHLCICDPRGSKINNKEGAVADLFATHPPIGRRIEALKQMAYTG